MTNDPYSYCPCGSGKKFKWCCQPIHEQIGRIYAMNDQGQHEAALRAMDELVALHATNPEAWGRKALLLFQTEKAEEAELALAKAFELFPDYPFGFFLKGHFRLSEGEVAGALLLFRKAAEHYHPEATRVLADVYRMIYDCEMGLNRPIAARAAADLALRYDAGDENLRRIVTEIFGAESPIFPPSARQPYTFKALPAGVAPERRAAWERALATAGSVKLSDAVRAFEQLSQGDVVEPAVWFNLGLSQAWLGDHASAITALDRYVSAEENEEDAAKGWVLAEVLHFGQGMEDRANQVEHIFMLIVREPSAVAGLEAVGESGVRLAGGILGEMADKGLVTGLRLDPEQGALCATLLEPPPPALTPELEARQNLRPAAYLTMKGYQVNLTHVLREPLEAVVELFKSKLGDKIAQAQSVRRSARFVDVISEAFSFPRSAATEEEAERRIRESFEKFFEEVWIHRPLKTIGNVAPIDAAGSGVLRKKLRGAIQFIREAANLTKAPYDFDRLLRKLGLAGATGAGDDTGKKDIAAMGATELAALPAGDLSSADLDLAYQTAMKVDAKEIASAFAAKLVERPAYPERPDRFPLHQLLLNQSIAQGNLDAALEHINTGEADDCKNNEGKRRNEYELRRAQIHARRGEFEDAERVYDGLIARLPTELNYRVNAAETMLSGKQTTKALKYAKEGLAAAVKANNRDLEGHFKELSEAAKKK